MMEKMLNIYTLRSCLNCKHAEQFAENKWACEEYYGGMPCHVEPPYDEPCQFYEWKDGNENEYRH